MVLLIVMLLPVLAAAGVMAFHSRRAAARFALGAGLVETAGIGALVWQVHTHGVLEFGRYLRADGLSAFFLANLALVFVLVLIYSIPYLRHIPAGRFSSPRWFYMLLFLFLFTILAVYLSNNLGLLWIMMEATTLASALLVGFYNTEGAVEAGWKYLVVCTVGLAFALFGTIVFYLAAVRCGVSPDMALQWPAVLQAASLRSASGLLKLAFIFLLVGYGTKIGLVPMHSWLPDAHAEAPSPISAMLSAALLNSAMYAVLRYDAIISRALGSDFSHGLLLFFGGASVLVAGLLMVVQHDLKRLLAYSSVEHMGIIAVGIGLGGPLGLYGALLHTMNHSMAKSLLFFGAGHVREGLGTSDMRRLKGLARMLPWTSAMLIVGMLAIAGLPPFGLFVSEFAILSAAFTQTRALPGVLLLVMLSVVFGAMAYQSLKILTGEPQSDLKMNDHIGIEFGTMAACAIALLGLGMFVPAPLGRLLHSAMTVLQ
jgi:hydrogenase-4 component F